MKTHSASAAGDGDVRLSGRLKLRRPARSMSTPVSVTLDGRVAVIRIDNPPVNALSPESSTASPAALAQAAADPAVAARSCVAGAGRTFVAGADIKGLEDVAWGADVGRARHARRCCQRSRTAPSRW